MDQFKGNSPAGIDFSSWDTARGGIGQVLADVLQDSQELDRKIQQSQVELEKLTRRNSSVTANLQQIQGHIESIPAADIRLAYDTAIDAAQRLFIMRGELAKLQTEKASLQRYRSLLEGVNQILASGLSTEPGSAGSFATIEMVIQAQEAERQRLSKQMHDGPAQAMSNFILQAEIATRLFDLDQQKAREELQVLKTSAMSTFQQVRDFIFQLRPMMLDDLGLVPTVRRYIETLQAQSATDIEVSVSGNERRLEPYLEVVVFRSLQELLTNALTHSQASEVRVALDLPEHEVRVGVEDNGRGFDLNAEPLEQHVGLKLIKERTEMIGGRFELDSAAGQGTRVGFQIPLVHIQS